jgi:lysophospholipase L1-like esterase
MIKDTAQTIVCYGDSNTWGAIPRSDERYPRSVRWTGVLQNALGDDYEVVSEGLCGRTLVAENPKMKHRTGITHLQAILESADPVELVIVMLGTNDVKTGYDLSPEDITEHLSQTIQFIQKGPADIKVPKILVICPPSVVVPSDGQLDGRMIEGPTKFKALPDLFRAVAETCGCGYINAGEHISSSLVDGYHWDADAHAKLAGVIAVYIKKTI